MKCLHALCVDLKKLIHMPCKIHFYVFATEMQSHSTCMVPSVQLHLLPSEGTTCRSYRSFVSTPLHPQFEMPHQTPSARLQYMPHTGMWCPFFPPFCHTCVLHTLCSTTELGGGGNPVHVHVQHHIIIHRKQADCLGRNSRPHC